MKKLLSILVISLITSICWAETCPSVAAIKSNNITGWKAYDSDDGTLLSSARTLQFKNAIETFALAEWDQTHNKRAIHCFYRDKSGSGLEAFLSKEHFILNNKNNYWYEVSGYMHCAAGAEKCLFENNSLQPVKQLAKK